MSDVVVAPAPRFIGLDLHKHYLVAVGVSKELQQVYGPQRVPLNRLGEWMRKALTPSDALVLEMTTNTWQVYEDLLPHAQSVTVVHPPHLDIITHAQVMNDKIAALRLAKLLAVGLIPPLWIPPQPVRDARALVAQRERMVSLTTQAKNRLHSLLHRYHLEPPAGKPFSPDKRDWWLALDLTPTERVRLQGDLDTLAFARTQVQALDAALTSLAAGDERVPLLVQLPGMGVLTAMTVLSAIGDIRRFPDAQHLVGYAGLGTRVHDSGLVHLRGRITKAGRKELRHALVEAAHIAALKHPHWKAVLARLEPRLGYKKSIVAIARRLLVAVWHVLTKACADRHSDTPQIAHKLLSHSYELGQARRRAGQSPAMYVREQLDRLGIGAELTTVPAGASKSMPLPPSRLSTKG